MTIAVDLVRKATKQTNKQNKALHDGADDVEHERSEERCMDRR